VIKPWNEYTPEERKFLEQVEAIRNRPFRGGVQRKTLAQMAEEQGVGPIDPDHLKDILRRMNEEADAALPERRAEGGR
jgi:hypothetical protein